MNSIVETLDRKSPHQNHRHAQVKQQIEQKATHQQTRNSRGPAFSKACLRRLLHDDAVRRALSHPNRAFDCPPQFQQRNLSAHEFRGFRDDWSIFWCKTMKGKPWPKKELEKLVEIFSENSIEN